MNNVAIIKTEEASLSESAENVIMWIMAFTFWMAILVTGFSIYKFILQYILKR